MTDDAVVISDLSVQRGGRTVVRDVSLSAPCGEITALLGPNGAGKSSLVLSLAGVLRPSKGSIRAGGAELSGRRPEAVRRAGVAIVPEGHRVLTDLSVRDNLRVAAGNLPRSERAAEIERGLGIFGELRPLSKQTAGRLSGGQQQMLALAQAMVSRPKFLIIDELSLGLAPVIVRRLIPVLEEIARQGVGVLLIEQFTTLALSVSTTANVMVGGAIQLSESAATLRSNPQLLAESYHLTTTSSAAEVGRGPQEHGALEVQEL